MLTDGRTDDGVTGILIAHLGAFGSGELKNDIWCARNCVQQGARALIHILHSTKDNSVFVMFV